jgi:copper chaperone CopZ
MRNIRFVTVALLLAACSRAPESRITAIEARIDGITCPTCVPPLKNSLKRAYTQSTVDVDEAKNTATVHLASTDHFSASEFRAAVERVRMRVVTLRMQACGTVTTLGGRTWLTTGTDRFLALSDGSVPVNQPICAEGTLDAHSDPATFQISSVR